MHPDQLPSFAPMEFLQSVLPLGAESIEPLTELVKCNSSLTREILALAMCIAIRHYQVKADRDRLDNQASAIFEAPRSRAILTAIRSDA